MSWASKRQASVVSLLIALACIPVIFIVYKFISKPATCSDGIQNQSEVGVDCGGPCSLLCSSQTTDPIVTWKRLFLVGGGVYNAVAYIENPNANAGAENVRYRLKVLNADGISMYERTGSTVIPAKRSFPIIETGINLGSQTSSRIEFKIDTPIVWKKENVKETPLSVVNTVLTGATSSPKLTVTIKNEDVVPYTNVETIAVLYDDAGNAMGASRTFIDSIGGSAEVPLIFTWPEAFPTVPVRIEVTPKLFI